MQNSLSFPFKAEILIKQRDGEQRVQEIDVLGLSSDETFAEDIMLKAAYTKDIFIVPMLSLSKLRQIDKDSIQAIKDWQYWNRMF